jgi:hypothetical protein
MEREFKTYKVPVGDWSKDGHNQSIDYYVKANYPASAMRQAYKDTCKKIGLQMNHNENYTDIEELSKYKKGHGWRFLLTSYEESSIDENAVEILLEHGFDFNRVDGERDENNKMIVQDVGFCDDAVFDLFMWFILYSMPDDFKYEQIVIDAEPIIGYWNSELNHQIGYGVFY